MLSAVEPIKNQRLHRLGDVDILLEQVRRDVVRGYKQFLTDVQLLFKLLPD